MNITIRDAQDNDLEKLSEIEKLADELFLEAGYSLANYDTQSIAMLENASQENRLWVAEVEGKVIGFSLVIVFLGQAHLEQVSVLPKYHRHGIGTQLVTRAITWARENGFHNVSLSTSSDVDWTVPLYKKCGFRVLDDTELIGAFAQLRTIEKDKGFDLDRRVIMVHEG